MNLKSFIEWENDLTLEDMYKPKKITRRHKIFGTYNERSFHFQLIEISCCLTGFHGNHNNIMTSLAVAILNFFSYSNLNTENSEKNNI